MTRRHPLPEVFLFFVLPSLSFLYFLAPKRNRQPIRSGTAFKDLRKNQSPCMDPTPIIK
jgi:hypothetical protein